MRCCVRTRAVPQATRLSGEIDQTEVRVSARGRRAVVPRELGHLDRHGCKVISIGFRPSELPLGEGAERRVGERDLPGRFGG
jgi:hypothetical protein